jgi:hypothetical protein
MNEIDEVFKLGERIGYGHLMCLASALWRRKMRVMGLPDSGAFVPTSITALTGDYAKFAKSDCKNYDQIVDSHVGHSIN